MVRGDAELAGILRRFLRSEEYWFHGDDWLTLDGKVYDLTDEEHQAIEEAQNG